MANWCSTFITFFSNDKTQLDYFHKKLIYGVEKNEAINTSTHIYNILNVFNNISESYKLTRSFYISCDKEISEVNGLYKFELHQEDAYAPEISIWEELFYTDEYSNIEFVFRAEEPGCDVFINTDFTGMFYRDRYYIDFCLPDENSEDFTMKEYFSTEQSTLEYVNLYSKRKFEKLDISIITNYFKENFTDEDHYFRLVEYKDEYNG